MKDADVARSTLRARSERLLHLARHRRQVRQLLRRQPPALQRQRREGDGVGEARLPARRRAVRRSHRALDPAEQPQRETRVGRAACATLDDQLLARVERVVRLTPTIVEVIVRAPAAARHFHPGPVLPAAELRAAEPARARRRSRRVDADGRHRAHRRLGRSRAGPAVADHARDGRVEPAVRVPEARRAGGGDGADRHADGDSRRLGRAARRRRPRQRRAVLDRQGAEGAGQPRALFRRLQERRRSVQARRDRGRHRPGDLGHRHGRRRSSRSARRIAHFRGNIVQAMVAYAEGQLGPQAVHAVRMSRASSRSARIA